MLALLSNIHRCRHFVGRGGVTLNSHYATKKGERNSHYATRERDEQDSIIRLFLQPHAHLDAILIYTARGIPKHSSFPRNPPGDAEAPMSCVGESKKEDTCPTSQLEKEND